MCSILIEIQTILELAIGLFRDLHKLMVLFEHKRVSLRLLHLSIHYGKEGGASLLLVQTELLLQDFSLPATLS